MNPRTNIAGTYPADIATYILTNKATGQFYMGSTNNLARRLNRHRNDLEKGTHHSDKLQSQFFGWEHIEIEYTIHADHEAALQAEQCQIDELYLDPLCCNVSTWSHGFWGGAYGKPQEVRDRAANKLRGYKHTDEFKEKCRQRMLGSVMSADQKEKISEALLGRVVSDQTRQRISAAQKGRVDPSKFGPTRALKAVETKRLNGTMGHTEASKAKIAAANFKSVVIEGVTYPSLQDAGEILGYGRQTVAYRLNSPSRKFKDWNWA